MMGMYWDAVARRVWLNIEDDLAADIAQWEGLLDVQNEEEAEVKEDYNNIKFNIEPQINMESDREQFEIFDQNGSLASFGNFLSQRMEQEEEEELDEDKMPVEKDKNMETRNKDII